MSQIIGIRREDKSVWERRVPLTPEDVHMLHDKFGIKTIIQPSDLRVFSEENYARNGAEISEDLQPANLILAVKEIPVDFFQNNQTYIFFSHVIKGQSYNMPMLKRMMELGCNLIDYEKIANEQNQRLIFFGRYAGLAGMVETLHSLGEKLKLSGIDNYFSDIQQPFRYDSIEDAKENITRIGEKIKREGNPSQLSPLVFGFAGYGNVSQGAQEILDCLPHTEITPDDLLTNYHELKKDRFHLYKVVFKEEHIVEPIKGEFDLQEYFTQPEKYKPKFETYIPFLDVLVNCIYWTEDYPRLITRNFLRHNANINLKVIGDISCDIDGSIEITHKDTSPGSPTFTYFPSTDQFSDGTHSDGITVMAVDILPCEFPKEASQDFSSVLRVYIPEIVQTNFDAAYEDLKLPTPIKKALILHGGNLTPEYQYITQYLKDQ